MSCRTSRRGFLKSATLGATGWWILRNSGSAWGYQANEKLNIALVGTGNFGRSHINRVARMNQNLVAVCDVNKEQMETLTNLPPDVRKYQDFRKMFDEMDKQIDAVIVAATHHNQPAITATALKRGKHVYCEKPLSHDVGEARTIRQIANECKVATQMGNQGIATDSFRRVLELVQEGAVGEIREAHVWYGFGGRGPVEPPTDTPPVPETLDWDVYLGPVSTRPYHPNYVLRGWNNWRAFGTGTLGMCGTHTIQMAFRALNLKALWNEKDGAGGKIHIEAEFSEPCPYSFPRWEIVRFDIPARGNLPAARINWYNAQEEELKRQGIWERLEKIAGRSLDWSSQDSRVWAPRAGSLLVGSKGMVHTNAHNSMCALLPENDFPNQSGPPQTIPRAGSHEREWANACKGGVTPLSNFDDASRTVELLLLGNIATLAGKPLEFDPVAGKITNNAEADKAIHPPRRNGWAI